MNVQRLGCLSPFALISTSITLVVLVFTEITSGNSMFSPGLLNARAGARLGGAESHADLGKDCGQCHTPFWSSETMSDRCLVCHATIQDELGDSSTLHGVLFREALLSCQSCHTEHNGISASLTVMDTANFPHQVTGFALTEHRTRSGSIPFVCDDCHRDGIIAFDRKICAECHRTLDETYTTNHIQTFGDSCLACHDGVDRYEDFDHSRVPFTLTGAHTRADCSECHLKARSMADLQNTPAACESCHLSDDAHGGEFGTQCGVCHSPVGWEPAIFDHSLAAFPLEGKHVNVECEQCHTSGYQGTPKDCSSCHENDDEHNGQYGTVCETCHNPTDWENATFDHSLSGFPLDGAHVNVECADCHKNRVFKGTSSECVACHNDPVFHAGMFPEQACSACHSTTAWSPARYDGPHTFPMNHGEKNNTCADCHQPSLTQWTCYTCHDRAEMDQEHREEGIANFSDCLRCHPTGQEDEAQGAD